MGEGFAASMADIFDDLFGDVMGGRRGRSTGPRARLGPALQYGNHAGRGVSRQVGGAENPDLGACETCGGSGAKAGSKPKNLRDLRRPRTRARPAGLFLDRARLPDLPGRGEVIDNPCPACSGAGRSTRERSLSVNIPAGIEDGTRIRLTGEGEAGLRGGPPGDLYIFLSIKPHPFFQREGRRSALPRADLHGAGGARRRDQGPRRRRNRDQGQGRRGHAIGPPVQDQGIAACRSCARANSATSISRPMSRRRRT